MQVAVQTQTRCRTKHRLLGEGKRIVGICPVHHGRRDEHHLIGNQLVGNRQSGCCELCCTCAIDGQPVVITARHVEHDVDSIALQASDIASCFEHRDIAQRLETSNNASLKWASCAGQNNG